MTNRERAWYIVGIASDLLGDKAREMADAIERALTAAVSDVQAQLDAERKAHAETRAALEAIHSLVGVNVINSADHAHRMWTIAHEALAASTRAKGDE